jgi:hypothetical protein
VLGVVQLHDLAADGGLKGAIVVWRASLVLVRVQQYLLSHCRRIEARHTRQVGQSSLSTDKGGAADGCAHGGRGADSRAHSAGAEESGGHCVVCYVGVWV